MSIENKYTPPQSEYGLRIEGGSDSQELIDMHGSLMKWKEQNPDCSFVYPNPENENLVYAYRRTADGRLANYPEYELRWENGVYVKKPSSDLRKAA